MLNRKSTLFLFSLFCIFSSLGCAQVQDQPPPFYVGSIGGYGATTWQGLVPTKENQNIALMLSTPTEVDEGGAIWGILTGYEFTSFFAIEANYMHYARSSIHFDQGSIFSFLHNNLDTLSTSTETLGLMSKLMIPVSHSKIRLFSSVGAASVHRKDILVNHWRIGPSFGVGVNYNFTQRIMGELAGNFTAGYGESQLSPVDTYFPFLYSVAVHLIYRL